MKKYFFFLLILEISFQYISGQQKPYGPTPSTDQAKWHEMEFYLFMHFGPNTFTDKEWGHGDEPEDVFNPSQLDCRQWCRIAKAAGAKGIIITAKHHDGFCLWPTKYSTHTVRESKWKNGKGDVLKELSRSCKEYGLKFGVYISPWDRNHPAYGTAGYNDVYINTMKEIFSLYGPIWELWWDGANGEGPNGKKQVYDFNQFEKTIRTISPHTVIFSDIGPDIRWVGNENGFAGKTNWNLLDTAGFQRGAGGPPTDTLNRGNINGSNWIAAECDVSIRPGWFYHSQEDDKVKTPEQLFELYLKSVGRGANLLLNVPPDRRGLIHEEDSMALMEFKKLRQTAFSNNVIRNDKAKLTNGRDYVIQFHQPKKMNCIVLREATQLGQRIKKFKVVLQTADGTMEIAGTTIGRKRIISFATQDVKNIRVSIEEAKAAPVLSKVSAYLMDEKLIEK